MTSLLPTVDTVWVQCPYSGVHRLFSYDTAYNAHGCVT